MRRAALWIFHKGLLPRSSRFYQQSCSRVCSSQNVYVNSQWNWEPQNRNSTLRSFCTVPVLNQSLANHHRRKELCNVRCSNIDLSSNHFNSAKEKPLVAALQKLGIVYQQGSQLSIKTLCSLLKSCAKRGDLDAGRLISAYIANRGLESRVIVGNHLIRLFSSCGSLAESVKAFSRIPEPDTHSWAAIISAHVKCGQCEKALSLYSMLLQSKSEPNDYIFVSVLNAIGATKSLDLGRQVHSKIREVGFDSNIYVLSALVDMYAKCGQINEARYLFENTPCKDVVSWNVMIAGYAEYGDFKEALSLFNRMQKEGIRPSCITYLNMIKAFGSLADVESGKLIHDHVAKDGVESDVVIGSALVDMYIKCDDLDAAREVFDKIVGKDIVAWGIMIGAYAEKEQGQLALQLFETMKQEGVMPDAVIVVSLLRACASTAAVDKGKQLYSQICNSNLITDTYVGNSLVDMFIKLEHLDMALEVFEKLPNKSIVSWNTIIGGFTHHGLAKSSISLFKRMQEEGVKPDSITYVSILKACGSVTAVDEGKLIHNQIMQSGAGKEVHIQNSIIDMYAKCGRLDVAREVFCSMSERDTISWNVMISGYAQHGFGQHALHIFQEMRTEGATPNDATFISLLSACSRSNLVLEGVALFRSMFDDFGISPNMQHYACIVDLLSRSGKLYDAENFIKEMPFQPTAVMWKNLLAACCTHGNLDLAKRSYESLIEIDPTDEVGYILMSNMYAALGHWEEVAAIRHKMESAFSKKLPS